MVGRCEVCLRPQTDIRSRTMPVCSLCWRTVTYPTRMWLQSTSGRSRAIRRAHRAATLCARGEVTRKIPALTPRSLR